MEETRGLGSDVATATWPRRVYFNCTWCGCRIWVSPFDDVKKFYRVLEQQASGDDPRPETPQEAKAKAIGGGRKADAEDDSQRSWRCGCYEDQSGYHLCLAHAREAERATGGETPPPQKHDAKRRDIKLLRDTVSMLAEIVWNGRPKRGQHVWSIPVDQARDWDCILTDAIDELEQLRAEPVPEGAAIRQLIATWRAYAKSDLYKSNFATTPTSSAIWAVKAEMYSTCADELEALLSSSPTTGDAV